MHVTCHVHHTLHDLITPITLTRNTSHEATSISRCVPVFRPTALSTLSRDTDRHDGVFHDIVTCFLGSQPIRRFIARRQLSKYTTILQALLGSLSPLNNGNTVGRCFLCRPCRGYITPVTSWNTEFSYRSSSVTVEWQIWIQPSRVVGVNCESWRVLLWIEDFKCV
jgi:hypothetical protein